MTVKDNYTSKYKTRQNRVGLRNSPAQAQCGDCPLGGPYARRGEENRRQKAAIARTTSKPLAVLDRVGVRKPGLLGACACDCEGLRKSQQPTRTRHVKYVDFLHSTEPPPRTLFIANQRLTAPFVSQGTPPPLCPSLSPSPRFPMPNQCACACGFGRWVGGPAGAFPSTSYACPPRV